MYKYLIVLIPLFMVAPVQGQVLHWTKTNTPPAIAMGFTSFDKTIFAATDSGLYMTNDSGGTWLPVQGILGSSQILSLYQSGKYLYASIPTTKMTDAQELFVSTDGGIHWDTSGYIAPSSYTTGSEKVLIKYSGQPSQVYLISSDSGQNWNSLYDLGPVISVVVGDNLILMEVDSNRVKKQILLSSDFGITWKDIGIFDNTLYPFASIADTFYASASSGIYRTKDKGASWQNINSDPSLTFRYIINDTIIGSGKSSGIVFSFDRGSTWHSTTSIGIPNTNFYLFMIADNMIYVRLASGDIYRTNVPVLSKVNYSYLQIPTFSIYPNPLTSSGEIVFSLLNTASVSLNIYNSLGQSVAKPIENTLEEAGEHLVSLDMQTFPPGVYYCRLMTNMNEMSTKFVILR